MKTLILAILATTSISAQAATLLKCNTPADALDEVKVTENANGIATLSITLMDGSVKRIKLISNTSRLKAGSSSTLIATNYADSAVGGEIRNAALLHILPGQKSANLAYRGSVFVLNCSR